MEQEPDANPSLCRAEDARHQIAAGVRFILDHHGIRELSIIAHSWGSIRPRVSPVQIPALVNHLVLFGPMLGGRRVGTRKPPAAPAWRTVTLQDQWERFVEDVPANEAPVLARAHFEDWGERYPTARSARREDPTGPFTDILHAWHGELAYDPVLVRAPVAIIRGEWDGLISDEDARWLFDAFKASPIKRGVKISRATHLRHLEVMRLALYQESITFLKAGGIAPPLHIEDHHQS